MMARLDGGGRERDGAASGLILVSPWRDVVSMIVEARIERLWTSMHVPDSMARAAAES